MDTYKDIENAKLYMEPHHDLLNASMLALHIANNGLLSNNSLLNDDTSLKNNNVISECNSEYLHNIFTKTLRIVYIFSEKELTFLHSIPANIDDYDLDSMELFADGVNDLHDSFRAKHRFAFLEPVPNSVEAIMLNNSKPMNRKILVNRKIIYLEEKMKTLIKPMLRFLMFFESRLTGYNSDTFKDHIDMFDSISDFFTSYFEYRSKIRVI